MSRYLLKRHGARFQSLAPLAGLLVVLGVAVIAVIPSVPPVRAAGGTLVQGPTGAVTASGAPLAFGSNVATGDVVVVAIITSGGSVTSVTDTLGSTYTNDVDINPGTNPNHFNVYVYSAPLTSSGADSVTVVVSAGNLLMNIFEIAGITTTGLSTGSASGSGTAVATSSAPFTSPYGFLVSMGTTGISAETVTPGTGFTVAPTVGGNSEIFSEYSASGVSGSSTTFPLSLSSSSAWDQVGVAFNVTSTSVPEFPLQLAVPFVFVAGALLYITISRRWSSASVVS